MRRLILFSGRSGTVLISVGLALFLVSLIPSAQLSTYGVKTAVPPKFVQEIFEQVLTPQQGLRVTVTANGTLDVYLLEVSSQVLYQWVAEEFLNVTSLEGFLEENPDSIGWHDEIHNGEIDHEYVPTKVTNVTLVLSNPSSEYVPVDFEGSITSQIAPVAKVRNLSLWTMPIGFLFSLPWVAKLWRERKFRR